MERLLVAVLVISAIGAFSAPLDTFDQSRPCNPRVERCK
jgi:hypothetical protein